MSTFDSNITHLWFQYWAVAIMQKNMFVFHSVSKYLENLKRAAVEIG